MSTQNNLDQLLYKINDSKNVKARVLYYISQFIMDNFLYKQHFYAAWDCFSTTFHIYYE